jgi:PKD repeat protein
MTEKRRRFRPGIEMLEDRTLFNVNLALGLGNEPTVAVDPNNPNVVAVAEFRTVLLSTDGGQTFPTTVNVAAPNGYTGFGGDASLSFDGQGNLYFGYLASNPMPLNPSFKTGVFAARINPQNGTIAQNTTVAVENPGVSDHDKEWIAADHGAGSPFANNVYLIWTQLGGGSTILFSRSTNAGMTWSAPTPLNGGGEGFVWPSDVAVASNGDVWTAWHTHTAETTGTTGEIRMRRSTDGGQTFGAEIIPFPAGTADIEDNAPPNPRIPGLLSWLQGSVQPRILPDPVRPGNIYVVTVDNPGNNYAMGDPSDIVFARSTNNGGSWTRSTISHGPVGTIQIMPAAAIDQQGNLAVTWYDTRRGLTNAAGDFLLDVFATVRTDGGQTFCTTDSRINTTPFDPDVGATDRFPPNRVLRIGEYFGLDAVNGIAYADWTGNTFTGSPPMPNGQQTIFTKFAIVVAVSAPTNQSAVEGASQTFSLGSFDDACGGPWSVDVNWGDSTAHTTFTATTLGSLGTQSHTYGEEGTYTVTVTVTDTAEGDSDSKSYLVAVSDPSVVPSGFSFPAVEGAAFIGQKVATFTDPGGAEPNPSDLVDGIASHYKVVSIDWGDGIPLDTTSGAISYSGAPGSTTDPFTVTGSHTYGEEGSYTITTTIDHEGIITTVQSTATVSDPAVLATGVAVFAVECRTFTAPVATFTDPGGAEPNPSDATDGIPSHYKATIDWGDSTPASAGIITYVGSPGSKTGVFTVTGSHAYAMEGTYTVTTTINHEGVLTTVTSMATIKDDIGLLLLDPTGSMSLMVTGNGSVTAQDCGAVVVDSSDARAAFLTGHGTVTAMDIDVTGGTKTAGHGSFSGPVDKEAATPDPLGLVLPAPPSPTFAAVHYSGSAPLTLLPGTYVGGIFINGSGPVTLAPGVYFMEGGGFSVTGQGSVTGTGVVIINAPGGPSDTISVSGQGSLSLTPPSSGPFKGVTIFQDPASSNAVRFTGQGVVMLTGVVYVPDAQVSITGNAFVTIAADTGTATLPPILGAMIAFDLKVDGNGVLIIDPDDPAIDPPPPGGGAIGPDAPRGVPTLLSGGQQASGINPSSAPFLGSGETTNIANRTALDRWFSSAESKGIQPDRSMATWVDPLSGQLVEELISSLVQMA